jgi:hypothetical protein
MVGLVEGDGRLRPPEKSRCHRFGRVDLPVCELLAEPGFVGSRASEYHEAAVGVREAVILHPLPAWASFSAPPS